MKKFTLALLLSLAPAVSMAQNIEKRYSLELTEPDKPMSLEVEMRNGSVSVEGYSGKTVEITAVISPLSEKEQKALNRNRRQEKAYRSAAVNSHEPEKPSKERSKAGLKSVKNSSMSLEIEESDNEVEINSEYASSHIALQVKVPQSASVEVELYRGGDVNVSNISGPIEIETWQGDILAKQVSGPIVAETHSRSIEVEFTSLSDANPSSLTTYSGDIDITLGNKVAAKVNVQNYQGEILSGLNEEFVTTESVRRNKKGNKQEIVVGGQVTAVVNGGKQDLSLITYSGNVYVRKP